MTGGQGSSFIYRGSNLSVYMYPAVLGYVLILLLNMLTLLAPTQSANNIFHSFTALCENYNFLISSLHCFFANVTPSPLVLLSSLTDKKHSVNMFMPIQYFKYLYLTSSQFPGF